MCDRDCICKQCVNGCCGYGNCTHGDDKLEECRNSGIKECEEVTVCK